MTIILNEQQADAVKKAKKWWKSCSKQTFEISGIAGSGKSTIVKFLVDDIGLKTEDVLYVAYVGKATLALSRKGHRAQTIHSTIYTVELVPKKDENGKAVVVNDKVVMVPIFNKKKSLPPNIKLIVLDEAGMTAEGISLDLLSFGIPMICLGDLNQLPPVFGESYFLQNPDVVLTEPMRQALDSPIIYLAQRAISGRKIHTGKYGNSFVITKDEVSDKLLMSSDINICGTNKTRDMINTYVRGNILHKTVPYPTVGEKIICRQNNWTECIEDNIFLINGLVGYVEDIYMESYTKQSINIDFRPEFLENSCFYDIPIDYKHIVTPYNERQKSMKSYYNKFEFSYAITCHLAQGSEYPNVLIFDERIGTRDYYNRWLYTAITRASNSLILAK